MKKSDVVESESFANAVINGLSRVPKALPPKFLYDAHGSELFDAICDCPEYYVTRTETSILQAHAGEIAALLGERPLIFELGSGASLKTQILLEAVDAAAYIPIDISRDALVASTVRLRRSYPRLPILPLCADFTLPWHLPQQELPRDAGKRVVFFPGSTIGNFDPPEALALLRSLASLLKPDDLLLIGVDLVKPREILEPAYDDAQGITAQFDLNILHRMQKELGAQIDPEAFSHWAFFNESKSRIEMHLVSTRRQVVWVLGNRFAFEQGETIHTESSYKYTLSRFYFMAQQAGFERESFWTDPKLLFGVGLFRVSPDSRVLGA